MKLNDPTAPTTGDFAITNIGDVNHADDSKLFLFDANTWLYKADLSGARGLTGDKGDKGDQGDKGEPGDGINFNSTGELIDHIIPSQNAAFDLGNAEKKIRHLFLSDNSVWIGDHKMGVIQGPNQQAGFFKVVTNKVPLGYDALGTVPTIEEVVTFTKPTNSSATADNLTVADWVNYVQSKRPELSSNQIVTTLFTYADTEVELPYKYSSIQVAFPQTIATPFDGMQTFVPTSPDIMPDATTLSSTVFKKPQLQEYINQVITQSFMFEKADATTSVTFFMHYYDSDNKNVVTSSHTVTTVQDIQSKFSDLFDYETNDNDMSHIIGDKLYLHVVNLNDEGADIAGAMVPFWFTSDGQHPNIPGLTVTRLFTDSDVTVANENVAPFSVGSTTIADTIAAGYVHRLAIIYNNVVQESNGTITIQLHNATADQLAPIASSGVRPMLFLDVVHSAFALPDTVLTEVSWNGTNSSDDPSDFVTLATIVNTKLELNLPTPIVDTTRIRFMQPLALDMVAATYQVINGTTTTARKVKAFLSFGSMYGRQTLTYYNNAWVDAMGIEVLTIAAPAVVAVEAAVQA